MSIKRIRDMGKRRVRKVARTPETVGADMWLAGMDDREILRTVRSAGVDAARAMNVFRACEAKFWERVGALPDTRQWDKRSDPA